MKIDMFDQYDEVIEVLRKKEKNILSKILDFISGGLLSTADSVMCGGRKSYYLVKKEETVYLLSINNDLVTKNNFPEIKNFNEFSKIAYNGYIYKKYRVVK